MYRYYSSNYSGYGNSGRRRRYNPYSYYYDADWYDWLYNYYYNRRTRRSADIDVEDDPVEDTPVEEEKPEPPKEEAAKVLKVTHIDYNITPNTVAHRTDKYECTSEREGDDGKTKPAELVVRRGQTFDVNIQLDADYSREKHDIRFTFTYGKNPKVTSGTMAQLKMNEDKNPSFTADQWGVHLKEKDDKKIVVSIQSPADCIVGRWDMDVVSYSEGKNEEGKDVVLSFTYECDEFFVLFNPWCKDDDVYMATEKLLDEYILCENGCVHQGSAWNIRAKAWDFAQFEDGVLRAALYVMNKGFRKGDIGKGDPIKVARRIALMVNSSGGGVLQGNWSGDYEGGRKPWEWKGSYKILKQFMETKEPVKYGQCWVFSCLTTSVCRALGIPCRSVTNFASAHDTEKSCTIDTFVDTDGNDVSKKYTGDSTWNFHVWNECWMTRPDLHLQGMNGWQAFDATPQEESIGPEVQGYTCGPCPLAAIKQGNCRINFDADFIFSEVNADKVTWEVQKDGSLELLKIDKRGVGKKISTKKPTGKSYPPEDYNPRIDRYRNITNETRLDVTDGYKYPEGSEPERHAVAHAYETARFPRPGLYADPEYEKDVKIKIEHADEIELGADLTATFKAINVSDTDRTLKRLIMKVMSKSYTGQPGKAFHSTEINDVLVPAGGEASFPLKLKVGEYLEYINEQGTMLLEGYSVIAATATEPARRTFTTRDIVFVAPPLEAEGPNAVKVGDEVKYEVSFTNPLDLPLTKCVLFGESSGFKRWIEKEIGTIPPKGNIKETFTFKVKRRLGERVVSFTLSAKELPGDASAELPINVSE